MNLEQQIPTINEIVLNAMDRHFKEIQDVRSVLRTPRFRVDQIVAFFFNGRRLTGRISNAMYRNGEWSYHIETPGRGWFREIDESQIITIT